VSSAPALRETFATRFGSAMTMIGVAVGLGNVWRFPYMVGKFGGAAFVLLYVLIVIAIGVPALMAEFALGRHTRRGPVGAFAIGGLPYGRQIGWFFFAVMAAAMAYYTAVVGWVVFHAAGEILRLAGISMNSAAVLPPETGFALTPLLLQLSCSSLVLVSCSLVLLKGLRRGIERASSIIMPALLAILLIVVVRALTLPGAFAGVEWYLLKFAVADINASVAMAALGQAVFSLSLGGTFMVVYGSYLADSENLARNAIVTAAGDTTAGLLAGLAIIPAVFALGMEPSSGPGLLFSTLPEVFRTIPFGAAFGALFFTGLAGAAFLSSMAALEVMVAGLADNTRIPRRRAVWIMAAVVLALSVPPSISLAVFVPWDLTFGSGVQTLGALLAVVTIGWCVDRSAALAQLGNAVPRWLYWWIRLGIPLAILSVGGWWFVTNVAKVVAAPA
jgi:NSS family neurotransmitter:Na+ symporter